MLKNNFCILFFGVVLCAIGLILNSTDINLSDRPVGDAVSDIGLDLSMVHELQRKGSKVPSPIGRRGFCFYKNKSSDVIVEHPTIAYKRMKIGFKLFGTFERRWAKGTKSKRMGIKKWSSKSSKIIGRDVAKFKIDMSEIECPNLEDTKTFGFKSYNAFFIRKLKQMPGWSGDSNKDRWKPHHPVDVKPNVLVSPADSKCFVIPELKPDLDTFFIKGKHFTLNRFLESGDLAAEFDGGTLIIFRLAPYDYHRFHFPFDCKILRPERLEKGKVLHSVNPLSYKHGRNPLITNKRHIIRARFADSQKNDLVMVSVGAMMVGTIRYESYIFDDKVNKKGDPFGWFEFGGSTIVLVFKKGVLKIHPGFIKHSKKNLETAVKMGELIGWVKKKDEGRE